MRQPPVRFGILGYGRVAPTHVQAIRSAGDAAELVAVCDSCPEALAEFEPDASVQTFTDLEEMLALPELDVVSICTPSGLHADHAVAVAEAGKHVVVEKPLDVTLVAVERMKAACSRAGVNLYPVFQNRFNPTVQLVKEALDAGRFGRILAVNSTVIWKRTQEYYDLAPWRGTRAMDGGAFLNQGIHFLDIMRVLGGEVVRVESMPGRQAREIECEDTGAMLLQFENGALGTLFVTMAGTSDQEGSITLIGERGTVKIGGLAMDALDLWEFQEPHPEQDERAASPQTAIHSVYGNGHQAVYHHILRDLQNGEPFPLTVEDAQRSLDLILQCYDEWEARVS